MNAYSGRIYSFKRYFYKFFTDGFHWFQIIISNYLIALPNAYKICPPLNTGHIFQI